jgi:SAM-dependent methyltransferase
MDVLPFELGMDREARMNIERNRSDLGGSPAPLPAVGPLGTLPDALLERLAARFSEVGYVQEVVFEAERIAPAQLDSVRLPLVQWWLAHNSSPARVLARLFVYADAVPESAAREAFGADLVGALLEAGLLSFAGNESIRAWFRITPLEGLWMLSDPPDAGGDAVMGPGITTLNLVRLCPPHPGSVLDLGCGAGTVALLAAARGSPRAVGVDINERAIAIARFNARLNRVNAEFRCGDLLAPVAGERFDRVFAQPPYVVQPGGVETTTYLHGGRRGDELALRFAAAAPEALAPRGRAFILFDSALSGGESLSDRLQALLGDAPVDLYVFAAPGPSLDLQAAAYASLEGRDLGERYRAGARRYRQHLEELDVKGFVRALVVLAESGERDGRIVFQLPAGGLQGLDAASLERFLTGLELSGASPKVLLASSVRVAAGARFVEERPGTDPQGEPQRSIRFGKGALGADLELSEAGVALFAAIQAAPSVAGAVELFAQACGEEPAAVQTEVVAFVRDGLGRGLLSPASE